MRIPDKQNAKGFSLYPLIQVKLRNQSKVITFRALIDSGAANCLLHLSVAKALGLDPYAGEKKDSLGIGGHLFPGYVHRLALQVQGAANWLEVDAAFIDIDTIPLLGRSGFFESHQIVFEQYRGRFEVNPRLQFAANR